MKFKRRRKVNKQILLTQLFLVLLLFIGIGYSILNTNLGINGTVQLSKPTCKVNNKLYNVIKCEAEENGLAAKYDGAHNDTLNSTGTKDIYYFTTPIENDETQGNQLKDKWNVKLGNMCFQMLRTADTGGVKLIYNGEYDETNKCNNTGTDTQIGTSSFNSPYESLAYVGYMYNPDTLVEYKANSAPTRDSLMGNDVTYSGGQYTLTNTSTTKNDTHHYTCNNTTGTCTTVRYYYYSDYYVELTGGKTIEDAVNDMLYADNVNKNNSGIKTVIDAWYQNKMTSYTNYLEDVIYCNDRSQSNDSTNGWNKNGNLSTYMRFKHYTVNNDLYCTNITDQFTVTNTKAKLTYPVGLMTSPEMNMINNNTARTTGQYYWLSSPRHFNYSRAYERIVGSTGDLSHSNVDYTFGVRPVVSLKPGTTYTDGTGTMSDPYVIKLD